MILNNYQFWYNLRFCFACLLAASSSCTGHTDPDAGRDSTSDIATDASRDVANDISVSFPAGLARHSSSIAISADGVHVYVVNPDSDSISILDVVARRLESEILLGTAHPIQDPTTMRYDPAIEPRAIALSPTRNRLYVSGERSSELIAIDIPTATIIHRVNVGSEPIGVLVSPDESSVFVACSQDGIVVQIDADSMTIRGTAITDPKPWALAWSADARFVFASHLLTPEITSIDATTMVAQTPWTVPGVEPTSNIKQANGEVRGLYDVVLRPNSSEIWSTHLLLATQAAQSAPGSPVTTAALVFNTTVFPTLSVLNADSGSFVTRLSTDSMNGLAHDGQFYDVTAGPHAIDFTADGRYALVVDTNSEDVLVVDAMGRFETNVVRPLPGRMPEGIVFAPDGRHAYLDERNTNDVAIIDVNQSVSPITASITRDADGGLTGATITRSAIDPMPALLREGQRFFSSANSTDIPITTDHWVACATCHIEGRSDAVVWRFTPGPRDTPSNAGGTAHTGFLFHTADRVTVQDYWRTIQIEQGGHVTAADTVLLDALAAYVNNAIPYPIPPHTDPTRVAHGSEIFNRPVVGCAGCHSGTYFTDSGSGNPTLDLRGPLALHDVGTCNAGVFPDVAHTDDNGNARQPCFFDTPSLRGVADSAPYFHDGSARTIREALINTRGRMGDIRSLSDSEIDDLVEYLRSL